MSQFERNEKQDQCDTGQPKCSQIFGLSLGNGGYWEAPDMCGYW